MDPLFHKNTILCVDDSSDILFICKEILERNGFEVFTAGDGQEGLDCLKEHSVDAAVIDNEMPGMSGFQLASEIKSTCKDLPVLMFSGSFAKPTGAAVDHYLNKSDGPRALVDAVHRLVHNHSPAATPAIQ